MVVMVVTSGNSTFRCKPRLTIQPLLIFLVKYKILLHLEIKKAIQGAIFKKAVRGSATIKYLKLFQSNLEYQKVFL